MIFILRSGERGWFGRVEGAGESAANGRCGGVSLVLRREGNGEEEGKIEDGRRGERHDQRNDQGDHDEEQAIIWDLKGPR